MRIGLNLASRPYADLGPAMKRLRMTMGALAVLCLAMGLGLHAVHNKAEEARARAHSLDGKIMHVQQERQGYHDLMQQPDNARLLKAAQTLNPIFDEKAFSWTLAMENLETVLPGGVQVTTLEPTRAKDGHITLHFRVAGPRDLGEELVRNLEHSKRFLQPRITGETAESGGTGPGNGPNQRMEPVSASNRFDFDLLAEYNPPTPEERKAEKAEGKNKPEAETPSVGAEPAGSTPARTPSAARRVPRMQPNVQPQTPPVHQQPARPTPGRLRNPFPPQGGQQ